MIDTTNLQVKIAICNILFFGLKNITESHLSAICCLYCVQETKTKIYSKANVIRLLYLPCNHHLIYH